MPNLRPAASKARRPSGITSFPMPSPGMTAIRNFFMETLLGSDVVRWRMAQIQSAALGCPWHAGACALCRCPRLGCGFACVFLAETLDTARGVHDLLLAGVERMA